jgi:pimeloyl-ACP methyl ester carboxylesterase
VTSLIVTLTLPSTRDAGPGPGPAVSNLKVVLRSYGDDQLFGESYGEELVRVVWLHGWARTSSDFAECARELADAGVGSVALDLPGFGASPAPLVAGGAGPYAQVVARALPAIAAGPVVLVGHSFGGRVAVVVAANHPELVAAVVLTGTPLTAPARRRSPTAYRVARWLRARGVLSETTMERYRQRYGSSDYRRASGVMRDVLVASVNENYDDELTRVRAPVTMLWGELDRDVPLDVAERARTLLRVPTTLRTVAGVGHLVPTEAPAELARSVREALE